MEGERGCHTPIGGKIAQLDRQERRTLDSPRSVRMSGRALRVCSALHAAHHFTDGAAIDGSKAGRVQETCEGDGEANTEDRLAIQKLKDKKPNLTYELLNEHQASVVPGLKKVKSHSNTNFQQTDPTQPGHEESVLKARENVTRKYNELRLINLMEKAIGEGKTFDQFITSMPDEVRPDYIVRGSREFQYWKQLHHKQKPNERAFTPDEIKHIKSMEKSTEFHRVR